MRLAQTYTYPSEIPAEASMASMIWAANSEHRQATEPYDPFHLEVDSASEFFGLDNEQMMSLNPRQKRALTFLMWQIDDQTQEGETADAVLKEHNEETVPWYIKEHGVTDPDEIDELRFTPEDAIMKVGQDEDAFEEFVNEQLDMASLVVAGNRTLTKRLNDEYAKKIQRETEELRREEERLEATA